MNENIITVNINHMGIKITLLCVYAPSNDKVNFRKRSFYEKLNENFISIGTVQQEK